MSVESMSEYPESTIAAAVENMNRTISNFKHISEYIVAVQNGYAEQLNGKAELFSMVRAAHLITNAQPGDFGEKVQAVYHGEVLGLELLNHLEPGKSSHFKSGYAQSFIRQSVEKSRPPTSRTPETSLEHQHRLVSLAWSIQAELSQPNDSDQLHPLYETFGQASASKLSDDLSYQYLTMMGYRMIINEALQPAVLGSTYELLQTYQVAPRNNTAPAATEKKRSIITIADLERQHKPSVKELKEIVEEPQLTGLEWKNITSFRKRLLRHFDDTEARIEQLSAMDDQPIESFNRLLEYDIQAFNNKYNLLTENDLLAIEGEFFAVTNHPLIGTHTLRYDLNTEICGSFDGLHVVDVPPNKQLLKAIFDPKAYENDKDIGTIRTIAIRIKNPEFITLLSDSTKDYEHPPEETIDIPLVYKNVTFRRIKAADLEDEA
jgi:hypothetical protein